MKVSVLIPVYNTERYVAAAIDSVLAQTRPADEVIVVDDGSTDGTSEVLAGFGARISVLRQPQSGPGSALNRGIARATGDFLSFLDADDLWLPDKLRLQCDALLRDPSLDAVFGNVSQFVSPELEQDASAPPNSIQAGIGKGTMLIRRAAFERIGLFDPSLRVIDFPDWYARALALGLQTRVLPEVVMLRRRHSSNLGRREREQQRCELLFALKRALDLRRGKAWG